MDNSSKIIPINDSIEEFKEYLERYNRVILSAKFGDGKSFFITNMMTELESEYLFIPIYPINYQIADNSDILEYIKKDILFRLLIHKDIEINSDEMSEYWMLYSFLCDPNNGLDITKILPMINIGVMQFDLSKIGALCSEAKKNTIDIKKRECPIEKE